ncbi:MAG: alpha/beta fold hydrolase [Alphaproteobacteria bacterium]|nr:alpha/beta fold hydrolase [Alphaproteobacteria bacterium]
MQDGFAIEFSRRGYVVLALDMTGHGYSDPPMALTDLGGSDALRYLRSLPYVDRNNIGLEGHSLGGLAVLEAAHAMPTDYRALLLVGSTTGTPEAGTPKFPRNAGFILGAYDEFVPLMWASKAFYDPNPRSTFLAREVGGSAKLEAVFGSRAPIIAGRLYGDAAKGTARELYLPSVTHPEEHFSREAIGDAMNWFGATLKGGDRRPDSDQIWYWKEAGTAIAFTGFVMLLLGVFDLLLLVPAFAALRFAPAPLWQNRDRKWWTGFAASLLVPGAIFLPAMIAAQLALPPLAVLPQVYTNQVLAWAFVTAALLGVIRFALRKPNATFSNCWFRSLLIAVSTVGIGYLSLLGVAALFHVDYRFWVLALKPLSLWQFKAFLIYVLPFTLYLIVTLRALLSDLAVEGDSAAKAYASAMIAMAGGMALFLVADYLPLFLADHLLVPLDPLHPIIGIQFVPVLAIVGLIATFAYRRTNSFVPGALISALFVTWYVTAGTATMFAI